MKHKTICLLALLLCSIFSNATSSLSSLIFASEWEEKPREAAQSEASIPRLEGEVNSSATALTPAGAAQAASFPQPGEYITFPSVLTPSGFAKIGLSAYEGKGVPYDYPTKLDPDVARRWAGKLKDPERCFVTVYCDGKDKFRFDTPNDPSGPRGNIDSKPFARRTDGAYCYHYMFDSSQLQSEDNLPVIPAPGTSASQMRQFNLNAKATGNAMTALDPASALPDGAKYRGYLPTLTRVNERTRGFCNPNYLSDWFGGPYQYSCTRRPDLDRAGLLCWETDAIRYQCWVDLSSEKMVREGEFTGFAYKVWILDLFENVK